MSDDAHARPSGDTPEPLYDVNIPTPTHAERARTLVSQISTGTLCTLALEPEGYPYGSFVTVAFDEGNPVFLISGLAEKALSTCRDQPVLIIAPFLRLTVSNRRACRQSKQVAGETYIVVNYSADIQVTKIWTLSQADDRFFSPRKANANARALLLSAAQSHVEILFSAPVARQKVVLPILQKAKPAKAALKRSASKKNTA